MFSRDEVAPVCRVLSLCFPQEASVGGQGLQSDELSASSVQLGLVSIMCVYLSLSLGEESLWNGTGLCRGCLHSQACGTALGFVQEQIREVGFMEADGWGLGWCSRMAVLALSTSLPSPLQQGGHLER